MKSGLEAQAAAAGERLDAHVREIVQWHFDPATGSPFWLQYAADRLDFDPRDVVARYDDLKKLFDRRGKKSQAAQTGQPQNAGSGK